MADVEKSGVITYKDDNGNLVSFYPVTKTSKVVGLTDIIARLDRLEATVKELTNTQQPV